MARADDLTPANAPKPGDMFAEKYVVERLLGVGGMGFVIAAKHVHLHERVAIKMLLPELVVEKETVERFLREGRAAVRIKSEHVVRVLDVGELPDRTPYLVMEHLDGVDLADLLDERGQLPHTQAVDYVLQACEAVAEAHAMGTVHRDLKPANLFLARSSNGAERIKVLDFGISKMSAVDGSSLSMTRTSALMGSPLYMSPEQLKSARTVDARADIWAVGVILHELVSGARPFEAETLAELGALVLSGEVPRLANAVRDLPVGFSDVVATCLRREAKDRFVNLADFADRIAPFGSPAARVSAARIIETLGGLPVDRAAVDDGRRVAAPSSGSVLVGPRTAPSSPELEAIASAATLSADGSLHIDSASHSGVSAPSRPPSRIGLVAGLSSLFLLMAVVGTVLIVNGLHSRRQQEPVSSVGAPVSISAVPEAPAEQAPAAAPSPAPSSVTAAEPPVAIVAPAPASSPHAAPRARARGPAPAPTASPKTTTSAASPAPAAPPTSTSGFAKSAKD